MKIWTKTVTFNLIFLAGFGVGLGAYRIHRLDRATVEAKQRWLICGEVHKTALRERAESFRQKSGRWPASVGELVAAHFLPEWSEVHLCPSVVVMPALVRTSYQGSAFVDENRTGIVAHYTSSPYRFRVEGDKFTVECSYDKEHN